MIAPVSARAAEMGSWSTPNGSKTLSEGSGRESSVEGVTGESSGGEDSSTEIGTSGISI